MKTSSKIELFTVGKLAKKLKRLEKEYSETTVACRLPDERICCITEVKSDAGGVICIMLEEEDYDYPYFDVDMLLGELEAYGNDTKVYMAACGLYLNFVSYDDGVFSYDGENDFISCDGNVIGEYEEVQEESDSYIDCLTNETIRKEKREDTAQTIVLALMSLALAYGVYHNVAAAFCNSGSSIVQSIIWCVVCITLLVICVLTLCISEN